MTNYPLLNVGKRPFYFHLLYTVARGYRGKTRFDIEGDVVMDSRDEVNSFTFVFRNRDDPLTLVKRYLKNKKLIDDFRKYCFRKRKEVMKLSDMKDFSKISDKGLIDAHKKYMDLSESLFPPVRAIRMLDKGGVEILRERLSRRTDDVEKAITMLAAPEEYTFSMEEEVELMKKSLGIKGVGDTKAIKNAAKELLERYAWSSKSWYNEPARELDYYEGNIKKLAKNKKEAEEKLENIQERKRKGIIERKEAEKRLKLNEEERHLAKILRTCAFLKDYMKANHNAAAYFFESLFDEIAGRTGRTIKEIKTLWHPEIRLLLEKGIFDEDTANKRLKRFFIASTNDSITIYYGKDADRMEKKYLGKYIRSEQYGFRGRPASRGYGKGNVRVIIKIDDLVDFREGEILVANNTTPEFVPAMKKAAAIITEEGGVTCHAAVVSRELGVPCVVGIENATERFKDGEMVEVDADRGIVRKIKP